MIWLRGQPDPHCDVEDHEHKHRSGGRPTRLVERHQLNTVGCRGRHWLSFGGIHARTLARSEQTVRSPLERVRTSGFELTAAREPPIVSLARVVPVLCREPVRMPIQAIATIWC